MKKNIVCSFLLLGIFLISFASAEYIQSENINLTIPYSEITNYSSSNHYNISVFYPNESILINNKEATQEISYLNYDILNSTTEQTGEYQVYIYGSSGTYDEFSFLITTNGKPLPTGSVIIFYNLLFIMIVAGLLSLLLYTVFHFIALDFDARDLIFNISSYFVVFAIYILSKEYLGNKFIDDFLLFLIGVGAFTTVILPIVAFIVCFIKSGLELKDMDKY